MEESHQILPVRMTSGVLGPCRFRELELRALFEDEELELILYNYREVGLIPKEEPL
jgi:hypothetical protein